MPRHRTILILLVVLGSLALGLYGCGKINPTAPESQDLSTPPIQPPKSGLPTDVLWPKLLMDCDTVYHTARIYEDRWNYVHLILPGWYNYFVVPEDAVEEDVTITIAVTRYHYWDEDTGDYSLVAFFEFGPDGLTFGNGDGGDDEDHHYWGYGSWHGSNEESAYLVLNASWLDLHYRDRAVLRYYNEDTGLWEEISSTTVRHGKVKFYFEHFSKYAVSR
ncbi:MAG: hypothetical protein AMJ41_04860 [candidate division Zixibacteria bacterium DG_27]|nr:MAG: hypothetical protein AMJ41_04860 [candidate division Zixibacteria bacterium DG_27]